jgi:hypothetical protein
MRLLALLLVFVAACASPPEVASARRSISHEGPIAACHGETTPFLESSDLASHELHGDAIGPCSPLGETLVPPSGALIDCQGGALTPADPEDSQRVCAPETRLGNEFLVLDDQTVYFTVDGGTAGYALTVTCTPE